MRLRLAFFGIEKPQGLFLYEAMAFFHLINNMGKEPLLIVMFLMQVRLKVQTIYTFLAGTQFGTGMVKMVNQIGSGAAITPTRPL